MNGAPRPPRRPAGLPAGLPGWLAPLHRRACALVARLPVAPPSFVLARALDRWLLPRLDAQARRLLAGPVVELCVTDLGLRLRLRLGERGFAAATDAGAPALRIAAAAQTLVALARGQADADRLFFERALVMEGDTELGLVLKNTLDAIGPLAARAQPAG